MYQISVHASLILEPSPSLECLPEKNVKYCHKCPSNYFIFSDNLHFLEEKCFHNFLLKIFSFVCGLKKDTWVRHYYAVSVNYRESHWKKIQVTYHDQYLVSLNANLLKILLITKWVLWKRLETNLTYKLYEYIMVNMLKNVNDGQKVKIY